MNSWFSIFLFFGLVVHARQPDSCEADLAKFEAGISCMIGDNTPKCEGNYKAVFIDGAKTVPFPIDYSRNPRSADAPISSNTAILSLAGVSAADAEIMAYMKKSGASWAADLGTAVRFGPKVGFWVGWALLALEVVPSKTAERFWCDSVDPVKMKENLAAVILCDKDRIGSPLLNVLRNPAARDELVHDTNKDPGAHKLRQAFCEKIRSLARSFKEMYNTPITCEGGGLNLFGEHFDLRDGRLSRRMSPPGYEYDVDRVIPLRSTDYSDRPAFVVGSQTIKPHRVVSQESEFSEVDSVLWTMRPKILEAAKKCGINTAGRGAPMRQADITPTGDGGSAR